MLFNGTDKFEKTFKKLDRLNVMLFNVWKDKNAEAFKNKDMALILVQYRNYISKMRSLSEQVNKLYQGIDQKVDEMNRLFRDISYTALNTQIRGYGIFRVEGETYDGHRVSQRYVAKNSTATERTDAERALPCPVERMIVTIEKNL